VASGEAVRQVEQVGEATFTGARAYRHVGAEQERLAPLGTQTFERRRPADPALLPWFAPRQGEPMGTFDHRDVMLVSGEEPYAFRGTTDVMRPHIRRTETAAAYAEI
jgi:hypothetical protein